MHTAEERCRIHTKNCKWISRSPYTYDVIFNLDFSLFRVQMFTPKTIHELNVGDAAADRLNPYHGVLTMPLPSKGKDVPTSSNGSVLRGPGRPPVIDISLDDCTDWDDPVSRLSYPSPAQKETNFD